MASDNIRANRLQEYIPGHDDKELTTGLYFLSEGYTNKSSFIKDCKSILNKLLLISPFNIAYKFTGIAAHAAYCPGGAGARVEVGTQYYQAGINTAFGGYFQRRIAPERGIFSLDYTKVEEVCSRVEVWSATQGVYLPLVIPASVAGEESYQYMPGAIIILSPAVGSDYPTLTDDERLQFEVEHDALPAEPLRYIATSANEGCERIIARALGTVLGLGDESEQIVGLPSVAVGHALERYPNLIYAPTSLEALFQVAASKWQPYATKPLVLHAKPDSATAAALDETTNQLTASFIGHWEGGGGYSNGIYRPSHDCIMRLKPGVGKQLIKQNKHPFCPVCDTVLFKTITGEYSTKRIANTVTLATQRSEFDKVSWEKSSKIYRVYNMRAIPAPPTLSTFVVEPGDESVRGEMYTRDNVSPIVAMNPYAKQPQAFWGYVEHLDDSGDGFYLTDVRVHQSLYYDANFTILESELSSLPDGYSIGWGDHKIDYKDFIRQQQSGGSYKLYPKRASGPYDFRDVFSRISFQNLEVTFDDGDDVTATHFTFDVADYIKRKDYVYTRSKQGVVGLDNLYQSGVKLQLVENRPGWPRLELDLSVVFRTTAADFDPGAAADALKCYPQIQFRWIPQTGSTLRVRSFDGVVQMGCTAKHYMYMPDVCVGGTSSHFFPGHHTTDPVKMYHIMMGDDPLAKANDVSCFTDSNLSGVYATVTNSLEVLLNLPLSSPMRRRGLELGAPFAKPTWAALFDYYYPHAATATAPSKQFVGSYRQNEAIRQNSVRKLYVKHPVETVPNMPIVYDDIFISKLPRQGAYDNIHVNGYMGKHVAFAGSPVVDIRDVKQEDVVAAPFCGQDCFHLHWRWALLSENTASINSNSIVTAARGGSIISPESYRGWNDYEAHQVIGGSLIPPNQHLDVKLTYVSEGEKLVEYKVNVNQPAPNENQVIMEQGTGWAMTYSSMPNILLAEIAVLFAPRIPHAFDIGETFFNLTDREGNFDKIYDFIRFHHSYNPVNLQHGPLDWLTGADNMKLHNHAQVPEGTAKPTMTWAGPLDFFVSTYRKYGDFWKILQNKAGLSDHFKPYDQPQVVVDADNNPQLAGITLEEL